jgi:hypothetical protein
VQRDRALGQRADHRVAGGGRQRLDRRPGDHALRQPHHTAAQGVREELRAEADAEHGDPAPDRLAQARRLGFQHRVGGDVADRLLAAEREQAVDGVEIGQRVTAAQPALVELDARGDHRGAGVAGEVVLEVVEDGDGRNGHACEGTGTSAGGFGFPHPH